MLKIQKTSQEAIAELQNSYRSRLVAPLDGMWEAFIDNAAHYEIHDADERIGYCCVQEDQKFLQFHIAAPFAHLAEEAFNLARRECNASGAMVSSFEPWLALCLDHQKQCRVHTYLYREHQRPEATLENVADLSFHPVVEAERDEIETFVRSALDLDGDWLTGYLQNLVNREEIFVLRTGDTPMATGELRVSDTQSPYADLGVIVGKEHRRKGFATYVLSELREMCHARELQPICSTTLENTGAQRAINGAGFVASHRLLEILFEASASS